MNIMIADVPKRVLEPVDTTDNTLLVHVIILENRTVELVALVAAMIMVAVALCAITHAANAATPAVQHLHLHLHLHQVVQHVAILDHVVTPVVMIVK
jgi:hypothetical protein